MRDREALARSLVEGGRAGGVLGGREALALERAGHVAGEPPAPGSRCGPPRSSWALGRAEGASASLLLSSPLHAVRPAARARAARVRRLWVRAHARVDRAAGPVRTGGGASAGRGRRRGSPGGSPSTRRCRAPGRAGRRRAATPSTPRRPPRPPRRVASASRRSVNDCSQARAVGSSSSTSITSPSSPSSGGSPASSSASMIVAAPPPCRRAARPR